MKPTNRNNINYAPAISSNREKIDNDVIYSFTNSYYSKKRKRYLFEHVSYGVNCLHNYVNADIRNIDKCSFYCHGYDHWNI